jgi:hypothetical protein
MDNRIKWILAGFLEWDKWVFAHTLRDVYNPSEESLMGDTLSPSVLLISRLEAKYVLTKKPCTNSSR